MKNKQKDLVEIKVDLNWPATNSFFKLCKNLGIKLKNGTYRDNPIISMSQEDFNFLVLSKKNDFFLVKIFSDSKCFLLREHQNIRYNNPFYAIIL